MDTTYLVLSPVDNDGTRYEPGDSLALLPEQAAPLVDCGALEPLTGAAAEAAPPEPAEGEATEADASRAGSRTRPR